MEIEYEDNEKGFRKHSAAVMFAHVMISATVAVTFVVSIAIYLALLFDSLEIIKTPISVSLLIAVFGVTMVVAPLGLWRLGSVYGTRKAYLFIFLSVAIPRLVWILVAGVAQKSGSGAVFGKSGMLSYTSLVDCLYVSQVPQAVQALQVPQVMHAMQAGFISPTMLFRYIEENVIIGQAANLVISVLIAFLIFAVGKNLLDNKRAFAAALIWSFWPSQIIISALPTVEAVFTFIMLLALFIYIKACSNIEKASARALSDVNYDLKARSYLPMIPFILTGVVLACLDAIMPLSFIFLAAMAIHFALTTFSQVREKGRAMPFYVVIPASSLIVSYLISATLMGALPQSAEWYRASRASLSFSAFVGMNSNSGGARAAADLIKLGDVAAEAEYDAQVVQASLAELCVERRRTLSGEDIMKLVYNKLQVAWSSDAGAIHAVIEGLGFVEESIFNNNSMIGVIKVLSNTYFIAMLALCLVGFAILAAGYAKSGFDRKKADVALISLAVLGLFIVCMNMEAAEAFRIPALPLFAILASTAFSKGWAGAPDGIGDSNYGKKYRHRYNGKKDRREYNGKKDRRRYNRKKDRQEYNGDYYGGGYGKYYDGRHSDLYDSKSGERYF